MKNIRHHLPIVLGAALFGGAVPAQACSQDDYIGSICVTAANFCPNGYLPADGSLLSVSQYMALYSLLGNYYGGTPSQTFNLPDLRSRAAVGATYTGMPPGRLPLQLGQAVGADGVQLTLATLPTHSHPSIVAPGNVTGQLSLPLSSASVSGQTISGSVTVNALNGASLPTGGVNVPTSAANTIGKIGSFSAFTPPSATPVAVPSSHNLTVTGGTVSGNASGNVNLPVTGTAVTVAPTGGSVPVDVRGPRLALTFCVNANGVYPPRP